MRSISTKLIVAFLSVGGISVAIIFITARLNTRAEFLRFLSDQSRTDLISALSNYHHQNGSWDGVQTLFLTIATPDPDADQGAQMRPFTLADPNGTAVYSTTDRYKPGGKISDNDLEHGIPIVDRGTIIG